MSPTKTKLLQLTAERVAELPAIRDKWLDIGLRTGEGDLPRAWRGIQEAYATAGREKPKYWLWMASPLHLVVACAILRTRRAQVSAQVRDQVIAQVRDQVSAQVIAQVSAQVSDQVRDQVSDQVSAQVRDQVSAQVRAQVRDQVSAQVIAQVSAQVSDQVSAQVRDFSGWSWWWYPGQFDGFWLAFYEALREYCDFERLHGLIEVAESCAFAWLFPDIVVFCAPPIHLARDESGRLHDEQRAALSFSDGWGVHAWHGVRVPSSIIEHPETITVAQIESCTNQELRRIMIERYGQKRYLLDAGAVEVGRDDCGILYRKDIEGDEPLVMVRVLNSTAEPDGSLTKADAINTFGPGIAVVGGNVFKHEMDSIPLGDCPDTARFKDYFLRVPPGSRTARDAVAWTFDIPPEQYSPLIQT